MKTIAEIRVTRIWKKVYEEPCSPLVEELVSFLNEAREKNQEWKGVLLWHTAAGSTPKPGSVERLDFTDPKWSIMGFMEALEKKL